MPPFLLPFFVGIAIAAAPKIPAPSFDYWASDRGDVLLKMSCKWGEYPKDLTCHATRVKLAPADVGDSYQFVSFEMADLVRKSQEADATMEEDVFDDEKRKACSWTPAEKFPFNGAYHKSRASFVNEVGVLKARLCESANLKALKDSWKFFEDFSKKLCEMKYQKFDVKFTKEKVGFRWLTFFKHDCGYRVEQILDYDPKGYKSPWTFTEQVDHKVGRRELAACEGPNTPVSAKFSATFEIVKPSRCEFVLDRERDWECCAFEN